MAHLDIPVELIQMCTANYYNWLLSAWLKLETTGGSYINVSIFGIIQSAIWTTILHKWPVI